MLYKDCAFKVDEVIERATKLNPSVERNEFFANKWLDFEPLFQEAGWGVTFYKQPYFACEPDFWNFKKPV